MRTAGLFVALLLACVPPAQYQPLPAPVIVSDPYAAQRMEVERERMRLERQRTVMAMPEIVPGLRQSPSNVVSPQGNWRLVGALESGGSDVWCNDAFTLLPNGVVRVDVAFNQRTDNPLPVYISCEDFKVQFGNDDDKGRITRELTTAIDAYFYGLVCKRKGYKPPAQKPAVPAQAPSY